MSIDQNNPSLHPAHLVNLQKKSGLSDDTIRQSAIYSVTPQDINKKLGPGFPHPEQITSLMAFPYPGCDGFERYKLFPSLEDRKYHQRQGTGNHLYIPAAVASILKDPSTPLYITEGEKKALKATQEGLPCIGMGGLWSWSDGTEEKNLTPDFDRITLEGRTVNVVPDNDWLSPDHHGERKNLRQAVYELAYRLIDRGAKVFVIELPEGPEKIGLDDYLCHHSVEEFRALPKKEIRKQTIEEMIQDASLETLRDILKRLAGLPETERAVHINVLAKKLNIAKRTIQKDIQSLLQKKDDHPDIDRLLESGANPESRFSAQNFIDGVLSFGAILGKERVLVQSTGEIVLADGSSGDCFRFKRSTLTAEAIKRFRAGEDVDGRDLLKQIQTLFTDHIVFRDERTPVLLGIWIVGTYMFKVFRFYGYIWVNSPVKRCGKSLLLDILSLLSFNSTSRLVDPSPSFLFREVDCNDGTLVLDEIESLGGANKDQKSELISLLNAGFQRGSQAPRMESRNREFVITYFNAYSPKALAGIKNIVDTLEDRSFKIGMARKKKSEIIKRFNLRTLDSHIEKVREDCFLWALRYVLEVEELYGKDFNFPGTESLDDRLKDILEPLLSIGSVIDIQADDTTMPTVKSLVDLSRELGRGREDQEGLTGSIPAVVNLFQKVIDGQDEAFISVDDLYPKFQANDDLSFIQSKKGLAYFLAKLDLYRAKPRRVGDKTGIRGYNITAKWLNDLGARYA